MTTSASILAVFIHSPPQNTKRYAAFEKRTHVQKFYLFLWKRQWFVKRRKNCRIKDISKMKVSRNVRPSLRSNSLWSLELPVKFSGRRQPGSTVTCLTGVRCILWGAWTYFVNVRVANVSISYPVRELQSEETKQVLPVCRKGEKIKLFQDEEHMIICELRIDPEFRTKHIEQEYFKKTTPFILLLKLTPSSTLPASYYWQSLYLLT